MSSEKLKSLDWVRRELLEIEILAGILALSPLGQPNDIILPAKRLYQFSRIGAALDKTDADLPELRRGGGDHLRHTIVLAHMSIASDEYGRPVVKQGVCERDVRNALRKTHT